MHDPPNDYGDCPDCGHPQLDYATIPGLAGFIACPACRPDLFSTPKASDRMARYRTIKPSFWSDARVAALTHDARLLLIGLISSADDEGRFVATPAAVRGYVYPFDRLTDTTVRRWLDEIDKTGIARLYRVDGLLYGHFPHWRDHQRVDKAVPSGLPEPFETNYLRNHEPHSDDPNSENASRPPRD